MKLLEIINGRYETPRKGSSLLSRAFPSFDFYWRVVAIVWKASLQCKRGKYGQEEWQNSSYDILRALEAVGGRFIIEGFQNLEHLDSPVVFVANHMSTLETFTLPAMIVPYTQLTFVIKESLIEYPVFKHVMRSVDPVTVGRANPRDDLKQVMEEGQKRLDNGRSIVIFPQTTRHQVFDLSKFNSIGVKLARRAGVPVIPVALKSDVWGNGRLVKDFGPVDTKLPARFTFGAPIHIEGSGKEEHQQVIDFITARIKEWGVDVL